VAAGELLRPALAVLIGLLLGSVLPADLLARARGVDIRAKGDGNPGTVNATRVLGWGPGLVTAFYDVSVGIVAIQIAGALGVSEGMAYLAGIATVVGHRFPMFLGFRGGGQGMAASAGMLVYGVAIAVSRGWISIAGVAALIAIVAIAFAFTRSDSAAAVVMLPVLVVSLMLTQTDARLFAFVAAVAGYIWAVQVVATLHALPLRLAWPMRGRTRG
jgi:acyl phosphate:glycerol-3-phosphate acyltransferase